MQPVCGDIPIQVFPWPNPKHPRGAPSPEAKPYLLSAGIMASTRGPSPGPTASPTWTGFTPGSDCIFRPPRRPPVARSTWSNAARHWQGLPGATNAPKTRCTPAEN